MESNSNNTYSLHLGIAEKGKMYAVAANYKEALRHYKEAIKMTQNQANGELFFQHYMQCTMEALELMKAYDDVINYCEKFLDLLAAQTQNELIAKYIAEVEQRMAIQYLLKGDKDEAKPILQKAQKAIGVGKLKMVDELLNWIIRGYAIAPKQIAELQKKHKYFIVSKENLKPEIAIELPELINHF